MQQIFHYFLKRDSTVPEVAKPENGFNYFTQKLLENYKQEKTPSPQTRGVSAKPQSSSSQQL